MTEPDPANQMRRLGKDLGRRLAYVQHVALAQAAAAPRALLRTDSIPSSATSSREPLTRGLPESIIHA